MPTFQFVKTVLEQSPLQFYSLLTGITPFIINTHSNHHLDIYTDCTSSLSGTLY